MQSSALSDGFKGTLDAEVKIWKDLSCYISKIVSVDKHTLLFFLFLNFIYNAFSKPVTQHDSGLKQLS